MTDTTAQHIAARDDADLRARLVAAAEQAHVPSPDQFVQINLGVLISTDLGDGATLTTSHAYASLVRQAAVDALPLPPGEDPAAVTDPMLASAVQLVWGEEPPA